MKKILIIGNSGSGKTWLSKRIAAAYGIPHIPLDSIFWKPGGYNSKRNDLEIENDLKQIQESNSWIVEGVFGHLADRFVSFADSLIYLDLPWDECKKNLMNRGSECSKQLDHVTAEKNFQSLLSWASEYEMRDSKASKKYHGFLYDSFTGDRHRIHNRDEADSYFSIG